MHCHLSFSTKAGHYCSVQTLLNLRKSNIYSFCPLRCGLRIPVSCLATFMYLLMFNTLLVVYEAVALLWCIWCDGKAHKNFPRLDRLLLNLYSFITTILNERFSCNVCRVFIWRWFHYIAVYKAMWSINAVQ